MSKINNKHCCERLRDWLDDPTCPIYYDPEDRFYGVSVPCSLLKKNEVWKGYGLTFCPGCGSKMPPHLAEERMDILEKEFGLDDPFDDKQKKMIPKEFLTDEWWKKRGL